MKYPVSILKTAVSILLVAAALITVDYMQYKEQKSLAEENQQLEKKYENLLTRNKKLMSTNKYMETKALQTATDKNGYHAWLKMEKKAEKMVKASDGQFKKSWALYLAKEAKKYEIDPFIVYELLHVETGGTFNPDIVGPETKYGRAYGMAQFMKNTAPWIADMAGLPYKDELLFDPYYSMQLSLVYLDYLHNHYGNWNEALTAYHRGMGGLEQFKEENGHAKSWYAVEIQAEAENHTTVAMAN